MASFLSNTATADPYLAGKFFFQSGNYAKAVQSLLQCKQDERAMDLAIKVVEESKNSTIARQVIDFFMANYESKAATASSSSSGDVEVEDTATAAAAAAAAGNGKSGRYLFKLYLALEQRSEAIRILRLVAQDDWTTGSYKKARDFLALGMVDLGQRGISLPKSLANSLMLLHSYLCAKILIKMNLQLHATKMLVRTCSSLNSHFQAYKCEILISAILQCQKTGHLATMQRLAQQLIVKEGPAFKAYLDRNNNNNNNNDNNGGVLAKYRRRWEAMIRRPDPEARDPVLEETVSAGQVYLVPCYKCNVLGDPVKLVCQHGCKSILSYCSITVR